MITLSGMQEPLLACVKYFVSDKVIAGNTERQQYFEIDAVAFIHYC